MDTSLFLTSSRKHHKKVDALLEPMKQYFDTDVFGKLTFHSDTQISYMGNQIPVLEHFFEENLFQGYPIYKCPHLLPKDIVVGDVCEDPGYIESQTQMEKKFNFGQLLLIPTFSEGETKVYIFATYNQCRSLTSLYRKKISLIRSFGRYFDRETQSLHRELADTSVNFAEATGRSFYEPSELSEAPSLDRKVLEFLSVVEPQYFSLSRVAELKPGEFATLRYLLNGHTAPQIAALTFRSVRTIESRIQRIREKLGLSSKSALISLINDYRDLFHI